MPDQDFTLPSQAKLHVTVVPFKDAMALTKSLMKAASGIQLARNPLDMDVTVLKDAMIAAATSEEVETAVFRCLERCTYEGIRVTPDLFNDKDLGEKARADYFSICGKVVEVNCAPFFDQTLSTLKTFLAGKNGSPK